MPNAKKDSTQRFPGLAARPKILNHGAKIITVAEDKQELMALCPPDIGSVSQDVLRHPIFLEK
jgi:hypothetical protein